MRLNENERSAIVTVVEGILSEAKVYLYGSRTDDTKKGGDIDLLVLLPTLKEVDLFAVKMRLSVELEKELGERRIDITISCLQDLVSDPFLAGIWPHAISLK